MRPVRRSSTVNFKLIVFTTISAAAMAVDFALAILAPESISRRLAQTVSTFDAEVAVRVNRSGTDDHLRSGGGVGAGVRFRSVRPSC